MDQSNLNTTCLETAMHTLMLCSVKSCVICSSILHPKVKSCLKNVFYPFVVEETVKSNHSNKN